MTDRSTNRLAQDNMRIYMTFGSVNTLVGGWLPSHICEDIFVVSEEYPGQEEGSRLRGRPVPTDQ
jgi:hypothetical protein